MTTPELPTLPDSYVMRPERNGDYQRGYYAEDMQEYGKECAESARAPLVAEVERLRAALLQCARMAEALKRPCGMDPDSAQAIRNGQYANIATCAHIALGTISGPHLPPSSEIDRCLAQIEEIGRFCDATYAAQEWRPIETAPKDGTEIIVGCDVASVWITRGARWVADGEWPDDKDGDYEGWWSYSSSVSQERLYGLWAPTYWIPMPYLTKAQGNG